MVCVAPEVSVAVPFPVVTSLRGGPPVGPKTSTANLKLVVVNEVQVNSVSRLPTLMTAGTVKTGRAPSPRDHGESSNRRSLEGGACLAAETPLLLTGCIPRGAFHCQARKCGTEHARTAVRMRPFEGALMYG